MKLGRTVAASAIDLSPTGRGIGRLWRPFFKETPKRSFGYDASIDASRVRVLSHGTSAPHPARSLCSDGAERRSGCATFSHKGRGEFLFESFSLLISMGC